MDEKVYARVEDNVIVQFPMSVDDINARDAPTDTYLECYFPSADERIYPKLEEKIILKPRLIGPAIYVEEVVVVKSVDEMFAWLGSIIATVDEEGQIHVDPTKITPEIFYAFNAVIRVRVQSDLDAFAQTRQYDDMKSLCSYDSSGNPRFKAEGERGILLRDTTWDTLTSYFEDVMTGAAPVPLSWEEIHHMLPELTWGVL